MSWENVLLSLAMAVTSAVITALLVFLIAYWALKTHKIENVIIDSMETLVKEISNDPELQKNVYAMGALLGNGAKGGLGLNMRGGKFKLEDIIIGALGQFLGGNKQESSNNSSALP